MLVAMAILAVVAGVLVLSTASAGNEPRLRREAERLQARIDAACERSELTGRDLGVHFGTHTYAFSQRRGDVFELQTEAPLAPYPIPSGISLQVENIELEDVISEQPQLLCFSTGERTALIVMLSAQSIDPQYRLLVSAIGPITLQRRLVDAREWQDWKLSR